jgi:pimeloyl-ACP methyl ester carboxylesterase
MVEVPVDAEDRVLRLRDGRQLGFAQYGDPNGAVVVNAHGGLACRLDVAAAAPVALDAGVRVISPDRPGIGLSDPAPGRTILYWAGDVDELMNQLASTASPPWAGRWAAVRRRDRVRAVPTGDPDRDHRRRAAAD